MFSTVVEATFSQLSFDWAATQGVATTVTSTLYIMYSPSCAALIPVPCVLTVVHESQGQQGPHLVALIKFEGTLLKDRVNYSKHKDMGMSLQSEKTGPGRKVKMVLVTQSLKSQTPTVQSF